MFHVKSSERAKDGAGPRAGHHGTADMLPLRGQRSATFARVPSDGSYADSAMSAGL